MSNNQQLYPNIVINPQSTKNATVQASDLTAGSLSRTLDLQAIKVVRGYFSPTTQLTTYFVYDVRTGLPIQLQQGDAIVGYSIYGPAATGGTGPNGFALGLSPAPTFDSDGVATSPATIATTLIANNVATTGAVMLTGLTVGVSASTSIVVGNTNQWLSAVTAATYTSGTIGVTLLVMNANLQEVF